MAANHKLTSVIGGRTVAGVDVEDLTARVRFSDGSIMTVHLGAALSGSLPLGLVKSVRQQGTTLTLDYDNPTTLTFTTAEPTASVMVRSKDGTLEYAD